MLSLSQANDNSGHKTLIKDIFTIDFGCTRKYRKSECLAAIVQLIRRNPEVLSCCILQKPCMQLAIIITTNCGTMYAVYARRARIEEARSVDEYLSLFGNTECYVSDIGDRIIYL